MTEIPKCTIVWIEKGEGYGYGFVSYVFGRSRGSAAQSVRQAANSQK